MPRAAAAPRREDCFTGRTILVASGKGGTGKSTLSVLIGSRLAAHGAKVLVTELDSGLRSIDIIAGVGDVTVYDLGDLLAGRCSPEKAAVPSSLYPGLDIVSAPAAGGILPEALHRAAARLADRYDWVLLDTAAGLGSSLQAAAACADLGLLVITPDPIAARDGRAAADRLTAAGLDSARLIINRVRTGRFEKNAVRDLDSCIDTVAAQLIGVVPESAEIAAASVRGTALAASCEAFAAVDNIACRLESRTVPLAVR